MSLIMEASVPPVPKRSHMYSKRLVRQSTRAVDVKIEGIGACPEKLVRWENESPKCIVPCFRLDLAGPGAMMGRLAEVFQKQPAARSFFT